MPTPSNFTWKFQRIGGLDQVSLRTAEELRRLSELDPKLWVTLSCPSSGLEFDARTLELIDTDKDGRIRIPEVTAAVSWLCAVLADPAAMVDSGNEMSLSCINTESEEGKRLLATARTILANLGKGDADALTQEDVTEAVESAAKQSFNGDGILPALPEFDEDIRHFIEDALAIVGGVADASGLPGINREIGQAFIESLKNWKQWRKNLEEASTPLGPDSLQTWELFHDLLDKIDDYYLRCELASYAPLSVEALNADEKLLTAFEQGTLDRQSLEELPLARIAPDRPLGLSSGLNPAWRDRIERLFSLVSPRLSRADHMNRSEWLELKAAFSSVEEVLAAKPAPVAVKGVSIPPASSIDQLGEERISVILNSDVAPRFEELAEKDLSVPVAAGDIAAVERLVLYYRHLYRLLMNFVSFHDFYSLRSDAAFQAGTLYLDGRSCRLCLPVDDVARHSTLAAYSEVCLVYCDCKRKKAQSNGDEEVIHIVAAMTAGDADLLLEGRNGVFVDNTGQDWDATLVKLVSNPISMRQALWQPYKRFGRMVSEQVGKIAGDKQKALGEAMGKKIEDAGTAVSSGTAPAPSQGFDIGKSVGIFAAIGLALGAIGTALASIANALFSLSWWQFPLVILGLFLVISGPSVILAWLKLRKRTLGPLLEASGWAVNGSVPINLALGKALTSTAVLPPNATRSYKDPFKRPSRWPWAVLAAAILAGTAVVWLWFNPPYWNSIFTGTPMEQSDKAAPEPEKKSGEKAQGPAAAKANATSPLPARTPDAPPKQGETAE